MRPLPAKRLPQASPADIPVGDALFAHLRQMTQGSKDGTARQDRGGALFPPPIADTRAAFLPDIIRDFCALSPKYYASPRSSSLTEQTTHDIISVYRRGTPERS